MATGQLANLKVYNAEYNGGMIESVAQMTNAFNAASLNAIRLVPGLERGNYKKESFFTNVDAVSRRDMTSVSALDDNAQAQDEEISVKLHRKYHITQTVGALKTAGYDMREMSFIWGQAYGERKIQAQLNSAIKSVEAAIEGNSAMNYDATGESTKTLTYTHLINGLKKFGDAQDRIIAWVMHSKPFFDLMINATDNYKVDSVSGFTINSGGVASLGRPIIVTDDASLYNDKSGTDTYNVLGLVANAVVAQETEEDTIYAEIETGKEQLILRQQNEFAFNVGCKGFKWDITNGGANPTDSTLSTTSNWDQAATSDKDTAGIRILVQ